jgi:hypothetical protein
MELIEFVKDTGFRGNCQRILMVLDVRADVIIGIMDTGELTENRLNIKKDG